MIRYISTPSKDYYDRSPPEGSTAPAADATSRAWWSSSLQLLSLSSNAVIAEWITQVLLAAP